MTVAADTVALNKSYDRSPLAGAYNSQNTELKQRHRRRRERRLVKNKSIFYQQNWRLLISVWFANGSKNELKLNTAVSTKVVKQNCKSVRDNAD